MRYYMIDRYVMAELNLSGHLQQSVQSLIHFNVAGLRREPSRPDRRSVPRYLGGIVNE